MAEAPRQEDDRRPTFMIQANSGVNLSVEKSHVPKIASERNNGVRMLQGIA
jgi:hypothetical protein